MLNSDTGLHTEPLRFWRVLIEDTANPFTYVEVGQVFLGNKFSTTRGQVQFPFNSRFIDRSLNSISESGQTFSDIREQAQEFNINWAVLTKDEVEELQSFFADVGTSTPFFVVFDNDEHFSTRQEFYTRYVKFLDAPTLELRTPNNFSMSISLQEQI
jgi:hypothetical protein